MKSTLSYLRLRTAASCLFATLLVTGFVSSARAYDPGTHSSDLQDWQDMPYTPHDPDQTSTGGNGGQSRQTLIQGHRSTSLHLSQSTLGPDCVAPVLTSTDVFDLSRWLEFMGAQLTERCR